MNDATKLSISAQSSRHPIYWVNIMERDDWLLINIKGRKLGIIMSVTEGGTVYLSVAGYHNGETKFIGEK